MLRNILNFNSVWFEYKKHLNSVLVIKLTNPFDLETIKKWW